MGGEQKHGIFCIECNCLTLANGLKNVLRRRLCAGFLVCVYFPSAFNVSLSVFIAVALSVRLFCALPMGTK